MSENKKFDDEYYETLKKLHYKLFPNDKYNEEEAREKIRRYFIISNLIFPKKIHEYMQKILSKENQFTAKRIKSTKKLILYNGDITELKIDAIINPANYYGVGCFEVTHNCLDNQIHSKAGPILREACHRVLGGKKIETSKFIVTEGYNLPAEKVYHVNGPIYDSEKDQCNLLSESYLNIINHAFKTGVKQVAFPLISTGIYGYPKEEAIRIVLDTVRQWYRENQKADIQIILCAHTEEDYNSFCKLSKLD